MKREDIEKAAKEAIKEYYNCNGEYPCSEREYCIFCNGKNTAYDCNECGAEIIAWIRNVTFDDILRMNKGVLKRLKDKRL